jgi:hypothetical protein
MLLRDGLCYSLVATATSVADINTVNNSTTPKQTHDPAGTTLHVSNASFQVGGTESWHCHAAQCPQAKAVRYASYWLVLDLPVTQRRQPSDIACVQ